MKRFLALFALSLTFSLPFIVVRAETVTSSLPNAIAGEKAATEKKFYTSGLIGVGVYPEVSNIDKGYNVMGALGYYFKDVIMLEVGLGLAKSQMSVKNLLFAEQRDNFNVNQYQAIAATRYQLDAIFMTDIKPVLGTVLSYTVRNYSLINGSTVNSGNTGSSTALDMGLAAGFEYEFNDTYTAGLEMRYMFNMSHQISSNYANPSYGYNGAPIESLQYYVAGLSARMNF